MRWASCPPLKSLGGGNFGRKGKRRQNGRERENEAEREKRSKEKRENGEEKKGNCKRGGVKLKMEGEIQ